MSLVFEIGIVENAKSFSRANGKSCFLQITEQFILPTREAIEFQSFKKPGSTISVRIVEESYWGVKDAKEGYKDNKRTVYKSER